MSKRGADDREPDAPAVVTIASDAIGPLKSLFGGKVPNDADLAAIGWGIAGARVRVTTSPIRPGGISIETSVDKRTVAFVNLSRDRRNLVLCENGLVHVWEAMRDPERGVTGTRLFAKQVEALRRLRVARIKATAIGHKGTSFIGYYAARYGFDGRINNEQFDRLRDGLRRLMGRSRRLIKLFSLPGGPEAWEESGDDIAVQFELTEGSASMTALANYCATKEKHR